MGVRQTRNTRCHSELGVQHRLDTRCRGKFGVQNCFGEQSSQRVIDLKSRSIPKFHRVVDARSRDSAVGQRELLGEGRSVNRSQLEIDARAADGLTVTRVRNT